LNDEARKRKRLDDDGGGERPTMRPSFDPERFARESESGLHEADPASSRRPTPRAFRRPELPPLQWGTTRAALPSAPELDQRATGCDPLDALGRDAVPVLVVTREELEWIELSPEASRLVGCVDGASPLDTVCAKASMAAEDGAMILLDLADRGLVSFL
jgi:hypothetical protein